MKELSNLSYAELPPILGTQEMRALDSAAKDFPIQNRTDAEKIIAGYQLMKEAGKALFDYVCSFNLQPIAVFVGGGNNGGDGLVLAKLLKESGVSFTLFSLAPQEKFKNEAALALNEYLEADSEWNEFSEAATSAEKSKNKFNLIVDCMLGNGAAGELRSTFAEAVKYINGQNATVIAADAPTGYDSANRKCNSICIKSTHTMMFGYPRLDAFVKGSAECFGESVTAQLSYPIDLVKKFDSRIYLATDSLISKLVPHKSDWDDKRKQGSVLAIAGSKDMTGAAILCTGAALRSGAGLVTLASPESIIPVLQTRLTESVFCSLPSADESQGFLNPSHIPTLLQRAKHCQAAAIGPGLSTNKDTVKAVLELLPQLDIPTVIDADALNAIATLNEASSHSDSNAIEFLNKLSSNCILTPHTREFARLFGELPQNIFETPEALRAAAQAANKVIILKTTPLFIATPSGNVYVIPAANAGMAKGGCGDVLTGIIAALLSQGLHVAEAAVLGALLHQKTGRLIRQKFGAYSMLPSDLIEHLYQAFPQG